MPELPEVESIRQGIDRQIRGRLIERVELRLLKQAKHPSPAEFVSRLKGRRILRASRRGKYLLVECEGGTLAVHLGMSGQFTFWDQKRSDGGFAVHPITGLARVVTQHAPDKHTHLLLHLKGGDRLQYRDPRQFGKLYFFQSGEMEKFKGIASLGLEPLDKAFTWKAFLSAVGAKRGMLKALLLAQRPIAGIGNIYADEALWRARLHPRRKAETLREAQWKELFKAIPAVLRQGVRNRGTTLMDYRNSDGTKGGNQERLKAYGRDGQPCRRCGKTLVKTLVSQRATVYCPYCQRGPRRIE